MQIVKKIKPKHYAEYALQLLNYQADNELIIYMDVTNINLFTSRTKGR